MTENRQAYYDGAVACARGVKFAENPYRDQLGMWHSKSAWERGWMDVFDKQRALADQPRGDVPAEHHPERSDISCESKDTEPVSERMQK